MQQLAIWRRMVLEEDWHLCLIIDGEISGSGKSVLAQNVARFLDPNFHIDNISFSPDQFRGRITLGQPKGTAMLWDEAFEGAASIRSISKTNYEIGVMLRQVRQMNYFIIIVLPDFVDLSKFIAINFSWCLLRAVLLENYDRLTLERGHYEFYSRPQKNLLYMYEKRMYSGLRIKRPRPHIGRFLNLYQVDEAEYRRRKLATLDQEAATPADFEVSSF